MNKIRFLLLLLSPMLLATTCDDDPSDDRPSHRKWSLVKVTGGIAGGSHEFQAGLITWEFHNNGTIDVVNNNPLNNNGEDFFDTGTYDYDYVENDIPNTCDHATVINGVNLGCQHVSHGVMTYTQLVADGYVLTLRED